MREVFGPGFRGPHIFRWNPSRTCMHKLRQGMGTKQREEWNGTMDNKARAGKTKRTRRRYLTFFFWDKQLHKVLRINRPANLVDAWNFPEKKRVSILYSDFRLHAQRAYTGTEAARLLNMTKRNLYKAWQDGNINAPVKSYPIHNPTSDRYIRWWGEHNIMEAHDFFMTVHYGRPRHDGIIVPRQTLPTKAEIKAKISNSATLYVQTDEGAFVPLWDPPKF